MIDLGRRQFITLLSGAAVAWPLVARALGLQLFVVNAGSERDFGTAFTTHRRHYRHYVVEVRVQ